MFDTTFVTKVYESIKISLLYWIYLLRGAVIYSVVPATIALFFSINFLRKYDEDDTPIHQHFKNHYLKRSKMYTLPSFLFSIFILLLYVLLYFLNKESHALSLLLTVICLYLLLKLVVLFTYSCYILTKREWTIGKALMVGFWLSTRHLFFTVLIVAFFCGMFYLLRLHVFLFLVCFPALYGFTVLFLFESISLPKILSKRKKTEAKKDDKKQI
ncbi:DUF624 domain-containing protein [Alkalihalobacillus trypoxylicola]|uniref:DUF624 domain-containing protein n=1 Tax=Alkalihalobacillus trypoxylicola TaxID=519424 RepID=A0A161QAC4_9BACI|nr:DUF624 domain-containing protein [Alkalihalobacillus trypoxylicola]KYG34777.1 hypothetical protein AZF04_00115 [Alkalihalobacillus trypoxylicola]